MVISEYLVALGVDGDQEALAKIDSFFDGSNEQVAAATALIAAGTEALSKYMAQLSNVNRMESVNTQLSVDIDKGAIERGIEALKGELMGVRADGIEVEAPKALMAWVDTARALKEALGELPKALYGLAPAMEQVAIEPLTPFADSIERVGLLLDGFYADKLRKNPGHVDVPEGMKQVDGAAPDWRQYMDNAIRDAGLKVKDVREQQVNTGLKQPEVPQFSAWEKLFGSAAKKMFESAQEQYKKADKEQDQGALLRAINEMAAVQKGRAKENEGGLKLSGDKLKEYAVNQVQKAQQRMGVRKQEQLGEEVIHKTVKTDYASVDKADTAVQKLMKSLAKVNGMRVSASVNVSNTGGALNGGNKATGGRFDRPTNVRVAEDGDEEYIIPFRKPSLAMPLINRMLSEMGLGTLDELAQRANQSIDQMDKGASASLPLVNNAAQQAAVYNQTFNTKATANISVIGQESPLKTALAVNQAFSGFIVRELKGAMG